jgi:UTP--glucose-1-phosphate uridylyltransferase
MGAAISSFAGARILRVPRSRFIPVKTTDDLLVLRSDVYSLTGDLLVEPVATRERPAARRARRDVLQAARRLRGALPGGPPSLIEASG